MLPCDYPPGSGAHMEVAIRPAKYSDIPVMCDLLSELFTIESDFSPDRMKQAQGLNILLSGVLCPSVVLVTECSGRVVGMCSAQVLVSTAEGGPAGVIEDLIVRKEYRRNGIGTRLLSAISERLIADKISRLQLLRDADNTKARSFYVANGWGDTRLVCMRKLF